MLRENYLRIRDTVPIEVYFVKPQKEDVYASYLKHSFLIGNFDVDFQYTKQIRVPSARLQLLWQNTEVFVLRPTQPWIYGFGHSVDKGAMLVYVGEISSI